MRLSVRRMLALVAVLAVPSAFWGWRLRAGVSFPAGLDVATIGVAAVSACVVAYILIGATRDRPRLLGPVGWGLVSLNMAVTVWFTSVEWAYIMEDCPVCNHGVDVSEWRFFLVAPRRVIREFPSLMELIARDIGSPCNHDRMTRRWEYRLFGGCLWGERHAVGHRYWNSPWYPPCAREAVRSWATEEPDFIRSFKERALEGRDLGYVRTLVVRMYDACPVDQLPANPYPDYQRAAGPASSLSGERKR